MISSRQNVTELVKVSHIHDINVVNISGDLSRYNMRYVDNLFSSFLERGQLNIILNFENLEHIDYQLVRRLADHIVVFQCEGGDMRIANASWYVQQILKVMGLEDKEIYSSVEDALMSFFVREPDGDLQ